MNTLPTNLASVSVLTIDTAPLDVEALSKVGRFQLRRLAEALSAQGIPICDTDARTQAFMRLKPPEMAAEVFTALKFYRDTKEDATPTAKPVRQPVTRNVEVVTVVEEPPVESAPVIHEEVHAPIRRVVPTTAPATTASGLPEVLNTIKVIGETFSQILVRLDSLEARSTVADSKLDVLISMVSSIGEHVDGLSSQADFIRKGVEGSKSLVPFILKEGHPETE